MVWTTRILRPVTWIFYLVIVCEILFMISPFALYYYSAYGPTLNAFHNWQATAWLTQFFLPHFSETNSILLNTTKLVAGLLVLFGTVIFFAGAIPIYWSKFRRRGAVTGGLYRFIRHPQYTGLAILGLGTILIWPRFIVLIAYITMLFLYALLARWEEELCVAKFGDVYRAYQARTGRFLPHAIERRVPDLLPVSKAGRSAARIAIYMILVIASVATGFGLRNYSLGKISTFQETNMAVLSPALLSETELRGAFETAKNDPAVENLLKSAGSGKYIVYVLPESWYLVDLPAETVQKIGHGHHTPGDFDRNRYKVLFTRAKSHKPTATGLDIVKWAYGRDPLVLARVDIEKKQVTKVDRPPQHVVWGDISTPMF